MSADVLRPRDCLVDRIRVPSAPFHYRRKGILNNGNRNTKSAGLRKPKKVGNGSTKSPICEEDVKKNWSNSGLVMGQVTLLKRGEPLNSKMKFGSEKPNAEVDLIGSETKQVKTRVIRPVSSPISFSSPPVDIYAGSAVSVSPSPNSLPVPSFFSKSQISKIVEDSATKELCRILRLE